MPARHKDLSDRLLAIKWLGNFGSHGSEKITIDDVLDAYEIMEDVLHEVYPDRGRNVSKLTKEINRKKGPRKRTTRPRAQ